MPKYDAGQRWTYRTREQDIGSTLLIGKVQKRLWKPTIIHVMIDKIVSPNLDKPTGINHMPFFETAVDGSVLELVDSAVEVPPEFERGFATWKEQKGGVFSLTIAEAVDEVMSVAWNHFDDPFDGLVVEMRAKQSEELIGKLYRHLFALEQWFFLCEPDNARVPVQWEFPEGINPTPALLAFTSRDRAVSAAVSLGVYPEGAKISVMPASVSDSVHWISGPDCANEWLCFNLTQQNFPLYVADAVRMLKEK